MSQFETEPRIKYDIQEIIVSAVNLTYNSMLVKSYMVVSQFENK